MQATIPKISTNNLQLRYSISCDDYYLPYSYLDIFVSKTMKIMRLRGNLRGDLILKGDRVNKTLEVYRNGVRLNRLKNFRPNDLESRTMEMSSFPSDVSMFGYDCQKFISSFREQAFYATGEMSVELYEKGGDDLFYFQGHGVPLMFELRMGIGRVKYQAQTIKGLNYSEVPKLVSSKESSDEIVNTSNEMWRFFGIFNPF